MATTETDFSERSLFVMCKECGKNHYSDDVKTVDIEEDVQGRDVLTFICPVTNHNSKSYIFME